MYESDLSFVPNMKWQFAFDTPIMLWRYYAYRVGLAAPCELLAHADLRGRRKIWRLRGERHGIFTLRIRKPGARAIVHHDVPFVPAALIVLIKDAADHN